MNFIDCPCCKRFGLFNECKLCAGTQKVKDPKEVLCNLCGKCARPLGTYSEFYSSGIETSVIGGYHSYHLLDLVKYDFVFCEECLRKLFNQCTIPPTVSFVDLDGKFRSQSSYEDDKKYYDYRVWVDNGSHHQAYINGICNQVKECSNKAIYTVFYSDEFTENCSCEDHKEVKAYLNSRLVKFIPHTLKSFL